MAARRNDSDTERIIAAIETSATATLKAIETSATAALKAIEVQAKQERGQGRPDGLRSRLNGYVTFPLLLAVLLAIASPTAFVVKRLAEDIGVVATNLNQHTRLDEHAVTSRRVTTLEAETRTTLRVLWAKVMPDIPCPITISADR